MACRYVRSRDSRMIWQWSIASLREGYTKKKVAGWTMSLLTGGYKITFQCRVNYPNGSRSEFFSAKMCMRNACKHSWSDCYLSRTCRVSKSVLIRKIFGSLLKIGLQRDKIRV